MDPKKLSIDISIPVYNEGENISETLKAIDKSTRNIKNSSFTVKIIYDFDEDNTLPAVNKIKKELAVPVVLVKNDTKGVVNAIRTGFNSCRSDYVLVTMADMSDDYSIMDQIVKKAEEGADVVCPSRYMKGGKLHGGPFFKQLLSRLAGLSMHWFSGVPTHDITNSYKLYKLSKIKEITLESIGGFEIGLEITAKIYLNGGKISELPTQWWDRTKGKSRFKLFKWLPKYLKWYFYLLKGKLFGRRSGN